MYDLLYYMNLKSVTSIFLLFKTTSLLSRIACGPFQSTTDDQPNQSFHQIKEERDSAFVNNSLKLWDYFFFYLLLIEKPAH